MNTRFLVFVIVVLAFLLGFQSAVRQDHDKRSRKRNSSPKPSTGKVVQEKWVFNTDAVVQENPYANLAKIRRAHLDDFVRRVGQPYVRGVQ